MKEKERFEVLLEELKSEFRHVAERVDALDQKFDRKIDELRSSLEQRIGLVETAVTDLSRDMHKKFGEVNKQFGDVHKQLDQMQSDIKQLDQRLSVHEQAHMRG